MKKLLLFIAITFYWSRGSAQQPAEHKDKLTADITEQFQYTIESTKPVKNGFYKAFYKKKTLIADGTYKNDKKTGVWHFFSAEGDVLEDFDYDSNKLLYEAPEQKDSRFKYAVDYNLTDSDIVIQPIKPGGRLFGYIPYLNILKQVGDIPNLADGNCYVVLKLLVSPLGRLADCNASIECGGSTPVVKNINTDQLADDDKTFIPATYNKKKVASQIEVYCLINRFGELDIY
ncbi:hypothetical protein [Mucilaginibacter sp. UR6-11]|uniref:hypothetical protein n=1 Tax=Mucilaginibacter sp. UR6-11 TaxID=1435644 RepID=UPI001E5CB360|nr:hypothetical protein [Mucilaginibacter sp. UR6-11]MCC8423320.1 hypothetical protein [Mucilaginibacter sp. UR6-11]